MLRTPTNASGSASNATGVPSSPPVQPFGFLSTRIDPASANASVTIANAIPPTRRLTNPSTNGRTTPTTATSASVLPRLHSHRVVAIAVR